MQQNCKCNFIAKNNFVTRPQRIILYRKFVVKYIFMLEKPYQTPVRKTSQNHLFDDGYYQDRMFHMTGVRMQID